MGTLCRIHGRDEKCIQNVRKPEWKTPHVRPWYGWEDIKGILKKQGVRVWTPFM
jgi:hypothetical protein